VHVEVSSGTTSFSSEQVFMESESNSMNVARRSQIGGGLAAFLGVLLLLGTAAATPGAVLSVHQMAAVFIVIGVVLIAAGSFARWYYLE
jgi:hypothetical protein